MCEIGGRIKSQGRSKCVYTCLRLFLMNTGSSKWTREKDRIKGIRLITNVSFGDLKPPSPLRPVIKYFW